MKHSLKRLFAHVLIESGTLEILKNSFPIKELTVLVYHKVNPDHFENQIKYLKEHYTLVSEQDVVDYFYSGKKLPENSVLLTFDDGYLNNYLYAYPVMKKYNVPGIIFLATSLIGKNSFAWYDVLDYVIRHTKKKHITFENVTYRLPDEFDKLKKSLYHVSITLPNEKRKKLVKDIIKQSGVVLPKKVPEEHAFMTWKQVREMTDVIAFGAHTHTHPILPNVEREGIKKEIKQSCNEIKKHIGKKVVSFCYPNGDYDQNSLDVLSELKLKLAFSSDFGRNTQKTHPFLIKRISANISDTKEVLAIKLTKLTKLFQRKKSKNAFKVVMLSNYYFPQIGGITTSLYNLQKQLKKNHIPVKVFPFPYFFRQIENFFDDKFGNKSSVHKFLVFIYFGLIFLYLSYTRLFYKKVIAHSHSAKFCAIAGSLGKKIGVKTVHTFRTHPDMSSHKTSEVAVYKNTDMLTAVSASLADVSKERYMIEKSVAAIPNGLGASFLQKKTKRKDAIIRILFVGHIFPIKDPMLFVKAVRLLKEQGKKLDVVIIGDGPESELKTEFMQEIADLPIRHIARVPHEEIKKYHKWADVYVSTSRGEGHNNAVLEALGSSSAVVVPNLDAFEDILEHKCALCFTKRTPLACANTILKAYKNRVSLGNKAYHVMETEYSWEKVGDAYINIYRRLVHEKLHRDFEGC